MRTPHVLRPGSAGEESVGRIARAGRYSSRSRQSRSAEEWCSSVISSAPDFARISRPIARVLFFLSRHLDRQKFGRGFGSAVVALHIDCLTFLISLPVP